MRLPKVSSRRVFTMLLLISAALWATVAYQSDRVFKSEEQSFLVPALSATKTGALDTSAGGDANGNGVINPGDRLKYSVVINNSGTDATGVNFSDTIDANTTYVNGSIIASPVAVNESYNAIGNVSISVPAASGVLVNDQNANTGAACTSGNTCSITTTGSFLSANGGNVTLNADGSFIYNPRAGFEGADTFSYTLANGTGLTDAAIVTVNVSGMIWFINNNAGACSANCDGRLSNPFTTLAAFNAANALSGGLNPDNNDNIFIYESSTNYTGGVGLRSGQKLIGQDATASLAAITNLTPPGGSAPFPAMNTASPATTITNSGGSGIALAVTGNTVRGLTVSGTSGAGISGVNVTAATIGSDVSVAGASGAALDLSGTNGTNGTIEFGAVVTNTSGRAISIQGRSGGAVNLSGAISDSGGSGIFLNANTGATINFTGGINLSTGANAAFTATGGGTVTATQNNTSIVNILTTTTGTALNIANTTIGANNVEFRSISANGAANGIVLNNTGSAGGLKVIGTGSAGSGGTIQNTTGADGSTAGIGIFLNNTQKVSLAWMQMNNHAGWAIKGTTVNDFSMTQTRISGSNGTDAGTNEGSVHFTGLTGSASISNSQIEGGLENNLTVVHSSGTLNRLTLDSCTIGPNSTSLGGDGINLEALGGNLNVTVQNSIFTSARNRLFKLVIQNNGSGDLIFSGNTLSNNHPSPLSNAGAMDIAVGGSGSLNYSITNNNIRDSKGTALFLGKQFGGGAGNGTMSGTVEGNTIGVSGVANSGSSTASAIEVLVLARGSHTALIKNNQLRGYNNQGLLLSAGGADEATTGLIHDAALIVTAQGNTIAQPGNNPVISASRNGIQLNSGTNPGDDYQICLNIGDASDAAKKNIVTGSGSDPSGFGTGQDIRLRQRQNTTVRLPGYTGATDGSGLNAYLTPRTNGAFTLNATAASIGFLNTSGGAACAQPLFAFNELPSITDNTASIFDFGSSDGTEKQIDVEKQTREDLNEDDISDSSDNFARAVQNTIAHFTASASRQAASVVSGIQELDSLFITKAAAQSKTNEKNAAQASQEAGETINKPLGNLPAGEKITIQFTVTVNQTPSTFFSVSNTANITAAGGVNINSTTATNAVVQPPSIAKTFGASFVAVDGTTSLTYTITNGNAVSLNGLSFSDTLPAGLVINTPNNSNNACGGVLTAAQNTSLISLSNGTVGANTTCTVKIDVKGTTEGAKTSATNAINSTNGGSGNTASATLNVIAAPTFTKAFGAPTIPFNGTTSLSFTITNTSAAFPLNNVSFTDTLPAGLVVSTPNGASGTCGSGTITANAGASVISLAGATLAANTSCTFSVNVTGTTAGVKNNSVTLSTTELGNTPTATASITVIAPPTIAKAFSPTSIALGGQSTVTLTLTNPNATGALTNASFTDTLANMSAAGGAVGGTCAGTTPATLATGATNLSFSGITIPAGGSCTVTFAVTGTTAGNHPNTTSGVTTAQTPTAGTASNTAILTVVAPPQIAKSFSPTSISVNGISTLTISITNPAANTVALTGVSVTDNFPSGLEVDATPTATNSCSTGAFAPVAGATSVSISGATIPVNTTCTFSVKVKATTTGAKNNVTGNVTSTEGGTGATAAATLTVNNNSYEADVAPRPDGTGDGFVNPGDITQVRRFVAGLDLPYQSNEFQRVDSAPFNSLGDGFVNAGDVTQVRRYAAGLDAVQPAGGPTAPAPPPMNNLTGEETEESIAGVDDQISNQEDAADVEKQSDTERANKVIAAPRELRPSRFSLVGNVLTVAVNLNTDAADTPANAVGFTLQFDTNVLSNPTNIRLGANAPAATTITENTSQAAMGRVGIVLDLPVSPAQTFPTGDAQLVLIDFTVAPVPPASTELNFGDTPVQRFVGDINGNQLTTTFSSGNVSLLPVTAASVTISGRVMTTSGRGVSRAVVKLTDSNGTVRQAITNPFGYYRFADVSAGQVVVLSVRHKSYQFEQPTLVIQVNEELTEANFVAYCVICHQIR